jgi:hypothetical protein
MPTFHLVVDEAVPVNKFRCRVRVWRQAGLPPLVLSSQLPGHPRPDLCSAFVANFVLRNFLGFSLPIPVFFAESWPCITMGICRWRGVLGVAVFGGP